MHKLPIKLFNPYSHLETYANAANYNLYLLAFCDVKDSGIAYFQFKSVKRRAATTSQRMGYASGRTPGFLGFQKSSSLRCPYFLDLRD